jgi:hypothetical protein
MRDGISGMQIAKISLMEEKRFPAPAEDFTCGTREPAASTENTDYFA